jgi:hypothetical protein
MSAARITDVQIIERRGPWHTKSNADLSVLFALDYDFITQNFLIYDDEALASIGKDIRGLRSYRVDGIAKGEEGAKECHKIRHELVFAIAGSFEWICEDTYGQRKTYVIDVGHGLFVPKGLYHEYKSLEDNGSLQVIANTLFFPDEPETHDSYAFDDFKKMIA